MIRTVHATRYVTPLREGGSLPAIVEADDDGMYVIKFRGAGQGQRVLLAELLCGELARALGLPMPELVFIQLDAALGQNEPDDEIQALVTASAGLNLALDYLPGSLGADPLNVRDVDADLASAIVWFDALTMNVDRTPRNPNLLWWHRKLWLIDHGAALYFHYTWGDYLTRAKGRFPAVKDHILLPMASRIAEADQRLTPLVTRDLLEGIVAQIPDAWLGDVEQFASIAEHRQAYIDVLLERLSAPRAFVEEAIDARKRGL